MDLYFIVFFTVRLNVFLTILALDSYVNYIKCGFNLVLKAIKIGYIELYNELVMMGR